MITEPKTDIKSLSLEQLKTLITGYGEPAFRAKQIYHWLQVHLVTSFDEI